MSDNRKKSMDDMFRDSMNSLPEDVPSKMDWNNMRELLNEEKLIKPENPFNKLYFILPLFLFISGAVVFAYLNINTEKEIVSENSQKSIEVNKQNLNSVSQNQDLSLDKNDSTIEESNQSDNVSNSSNSTEFESNKKTDLSSFESPKTDLNQNNKATNNSNRDFSHNKNSASNPVFTNTSKDIERKSNYKKSNENKFTNTNTPNSNSKKSNNNQVADNINTNIKTANNTSDNHSSTDLTKPLVKSSKPKIEKSNKFKNNLNSGNSTPKSNSLLASNTDKNRTKLIDNNSSKPNLATENINKPKENTTVGIANNLDKLIDPNSVNNIQVDKNLSKIDNEKTKNTEGLSKQNLNTNSNQEINNTSNISTKSSTVQETKTYDSSKVKSDSSYKSIPQIALGDTVGKIIKDTSLLKNYSIAIVKNDTTKKDSTDKVTFKKWAIGPYVGFNQGGYLLKSNILGNELMANSNTNINGNSNLNYSFGATISYNFTRKIALQLGVLYTQKSTVDASFNKIYTDSSKRDYENYEFHYVANYLEIPLSAKVYFNNHKLRAYTLGGITAQFNFPGSGSYYSVGHYDIVNSSQKKVSLSGMSAGLATQISLGLEYQYNEKWSLYIEPTYKYSFSEILKHSSYSSQPIQHFNRMFGVGLGALYHF